MNTSATSPMNTRPYKPAVDTSSACMALALHEGATLARGRSLRHALLLAAAGLALAVAPAFAEMPGTVAVPKDFWDTLWGMTQAAGIFGTAILGYVLYRVDKERVAYRAAKDAQTEAYIAQMKLDAVARAKTEELAQKYILGVEAMNREIKRGGA